MYQHILVPTDGSPGVDRAIDNAIDLAEHYGATLHALYVVDLSSPWLAEVNVERIAEALEEQGEQATADVAERAEAADVPVETAVARGTPHRRILEYADENGVDLIVMGTHGRTGLGRVLLGSVTEKVVRTAEVPVLTVRMPAEDT